MKHNIIPYTLIAVAAVSAFIFFRRDIASTDEVRNWINSDALIVDVRTPEEFTETRYEGAVNIPLAELEKNLHKLGDKEKRIIVYCRTGNRSGMAKTILESHGFKNVINGGGLEDMNL